MSPAASECVRSALRKSARPLVGACIAAVVAGMTEPVIPALLIQFATALWKGTSQIGSTALWLALATSGGAVFRLSQRFLVERACTQLNANFFAMALERLLARPLEWFWDNHAGAMQVRLERSSNGMAELVRLLATDALPPIASLVTAMILLWRRAPPAASACVIVLILLVALTMVQIHSQSGIRVRLNRAREGLGANVAETVGGIEQVKLFEAEAREATRVGAVAAGLAGMELTHHQIMARFDLGKQLVERIGLITLILWICTFQSGARPPFEVIATIMLLYERMFEPFAIFTGCWMKDMNDGHCPATFSRS